MSLASAAPRRILVLAPTGRDGQLAYDVLKVVGIEAEAVPDMSALCRAAEGGAGSLLIAEEALSPEAVEMLSAMLAEQPAWSDLPLIILAAPVDMHSSSRRTQRMLDLLGNVTILERPARIVTLVTAIKAALRSRNRQYEWRETLLKLERQDQELRRADQRKDEFLAMLAHEIRNPLAALSMVLALLERREGEPVKGAKYWETARRQMQNLVRIVDDLLDVSRISRGMVELHKEQVDFASILHSAITGARPTIEARQHELSMTVASGAFQMEADSTRLEQVISNLLSNAAKYTEPKGRISVRLTREMIQGTPYALLSVKDTGRGIPIHMLRTVFDMFVQVDQTIDRRTGGLGLGLTLVRRLVRMHGGSVEALSAGPGTGSEFLVRLPLAESAKGIDPEAESQLRLDGMARKQRILVVEDSQDIRESLKDFLEGLGHEVVMAVNGLDGVAKLLELIPDLALVDIGLPGIDGYELARRVRAQSGGERTYLVALTGYGGPEARAKAEGAGFDLHLTKPVSAAELSKLVNRASHTAPGSLHS